MVVIGLLMLSKESTALLQTKQVNFLALVLHKIPFILVLHLVILMMMEPLMVMLERLQVKQTFKLISLKLDSSRYNVVTATVTGVQTSVTTGLSTAWDAIQ